MATNTPFEMFGTTSLATLGLSVPVLILLSRRSTQTCSILFSFSCVSLLSVAWFTLVSQAVPQPYLDEVFHIPQAERFCEDRFSEWDDKITTPPGLYFLSVLFKKAADAIGKPWLFDCGVSALRFTNVLGLVALASLALLCRHEIESRLSEMDSSGRRRRISACAVHTAVNIALFPVLFFFSGLYYTDVISTAAVLAAFLNHLKRVGRGRSSWVSDVMTIFLGIGTLFMRQTNVFWVVVWLGGLEAVHAIKTLRPERVDEPLMTSLGTRLRFYCWRYSVGDVHDPPLRHAWPDDVLFTVVSFGTAALCNPIHVMRQTWPYISVLVAFASFVAWNGGVVLGDKSNHVATIHLAQLLYIWPFFAFFSMPLFLPYAVPLLDRAFNPNRIESRRPREADPSDASSRPAAARKPCPPGKGRIVSTTKNSTAPPLDSISPSSARLSPALRTACLIFNPPLPVWLLYLLGTLAASAAIVHFNTITHPFTLADNRHYMFYIFRYTIRRGTLVRLLLIVPYTLTRWMAWGTFAGGEDDWMASARNALSPSYDSGVPPLGPLARHPFRVTGGSQKGGTKATISKDKVMTTPEADGRARDAADDDDALAFSCGPVPTSTGLVLVLTMALSLMTAPLVEPRYFIIPWVMWRLLVPAWRMHDRSSRNGKHGGLLAVCARHDVRFFLETTWLMAINTATGYIFLTKPYVWRDESGQVLDGGRLQRFMW